MMVPYTGNYSPIRQYMKAKPTQYGIKIWCLANSVSKYVQHMEVYCGASTSEDDNHATGFKIVNQLMRGHEGKGHIVTCDNFFTSPKLFWCLLQKGIYATGRCRSNRVGWPNALTINPRTRSRGQLWFRMHASGRMAAICWFDNKPVTLLSTAFSPLDANGQVYISRWHNGEFVSVPCSPILIHYQETMRGVDVQDQLRGYYSVQQKDHKWWHRILFHILDTSFVNAYIIYKSHMAHFGKKCLNHVKFNLVVANALMAGYTVREVPRTTIVDEVVPRPTKLHYTEK